MKHYNAVVVGGGMVGLATAKGLADQGMTIAVIESKLPELNWNDDGYSCRVSAINAASQNYLRALGIWQNICEDRVLPYTSMHVWDQLGQGSILMQACEAGVQQLGFIIENRVIIRALWNALSGRENVDLYAPYRVEAVTEDEQANECKSEWNVKLNEGVNLAADVLIGADGANSWLRNYFDIPLHQKAYDHSAIVATVEIEHSHQFTAWQCFMPTGPLAFLPLSNTQQCSIVWSVETEQAKSLMTLDEQAFEQLLSESFEGRLGKCKLVSQRMAFPLIERHAQTYIKEGIALVGDAAHTIHPLAGQGVNLGFKDSEALVNVIVNAKQKGRSYRAESTLLAYERERRLDNQMMIYGMQGFKQLFGHNHSVLQKVRSIGLNAVDRSLMAKRFFIKQAMGV